MGFPERLAGQLARPHGMVGRLLGRSMDLANRRPVSGALDLLDPRAGEHVLDAGCGTGEALRQLVRRVPCHVTGIDPSPVMVATARRRLGRHGQVVCSSIENWPASGYDAVLALNVLYFCGADGAMIAALRNMLKPGGRLVAYVTDRAAMEGWAFTRAGRHRLFDADDLTQALHDAGFAQGRIKVQSGRVTRGVTGLWAVARN